MEIPIFLAWITIFPGFLVFFLWFSHGFPFQPPWAPGRAHLCSEITPGHHDVHIRAAGAREVDPSGKDWDLKTGSSLENMGQFHKKKNIGKQKTSWEVMEVMKGKIATICPP